MARNFTERAPLIGLRFDRVSLFVEFFYAVLSASFSLPAS